MSTSFFLALRLQWLISVENYIAINPHKPFIFDSWQQYSESGRESRKTATTLRQTSPNLLTHNSNRYAQKQGREHCNTLFVFSKGSHRQMETSNKPVQHGQWRDHCIIVINTYVHCSLHKRAHVQIMKALYWISCLYYFILVLQ